ncbi:T6SS immunity protein Tli4 family protein [Serratia aquatilis]|uniref:T6SS immunity protein Tli4 family protein n=1 Tax=Serratia aquatilis TaxID=1737515 RepID=A0ABV6EI55_9GAMM
MQVKASIMLAAIFCIAIIGYLFFYRDLPAPPLTPEEKTIMDSLFAKTKSQCIGRYLFDVPEPFYNSLSDSVKINDMHITSKRLYHPAFEQRIRLREQELKKSSVLYPKNSPFLKQTYPLKNIDGVIFDRNTNGSDPAFIRTLEGHLFSNGIAFIVTTEIRDLSGEQFSDVRESYLRTGSSEAQLNTKPQKLAEMKDLLSRLSGRKDDEIPTQPGTCIPEGFIRDNGSQNKETILFVYKNENFTLGIKSNNTLEKNVSLLERGSEIQNAIRSSHSHTMRKGKVSLPGIDAEEWLIRSKQDINDNMVDFFAFTLYGNEKIASYKHPVFSIKLHNRRLVTTHYSDAQLVDIWDRITRTFRVRPGAF